MAVIRWEPVAELGTIQNEMNRLFNTLFDQPQATGRNDAAGRRWIPAMDLIETGDQYVLRADLPGLSEEDVSVAARGQRPDDLGRAQGRARGPAGRATTGSSAPSAGSPAR